MNSSALLSIAVVTQNRALLESFLAQQAQVFADAGIELLICCSNVKADVVECRLRNYGSKRILEDHAKSGPNKRRNMLLTQASGEFIMFMDDDSVFVEPHVSVPLLMNHVRQNRDWLLCTAQYKHRSGRQSVVAPQPYTIKGAGSGIEWNQIFRRSVICQAGGWHDDFCTGEKWGSGGALKLMIRLHSMGYRQSELPEIAIEHPAQLDESASDCVGKMRRYRYAIGAVIASERNTLGLASVSIWCLRCMLLAPLRGLIDAARGRRTSAEVRCSTPIDVARGAFDWFVLR